MNQHVISSSPYTWGRDKMKRDMDLIRRIMLRIEEKADLRHETIIIEGEHEERVGHHIDMLYQSGFIDGIRSQPLSSPFGIVMVKDLSWDGHEFIAAIRNDTVFGRLKETFTPAELSSTSLKVIAEISLELSKAWMKQKLGLGG